MAHTRKQPSTPEGTVDHVRVCLRVLGDELDPQEITKLLGRKPTRSGKKGDSVLRPNGKSSRRRRNGAWLLDVTPKPDATVDAALTELLSKLPEDSDTWLSLTRRFQVELLCAITVRGIDQGFVLSPDILQQVAGLGVSLGVEVFIETDDETDATLAERLEGLD
jgi:hypothetical protein